MHLWRDRITELAAAPPATEDELTWQLIEEMAVKGAELLLPVFEREDGRAGTPLDPDEPEVLPGRNADHRAGDPFRRARAEHAGEGSRHPRRGPGARGRDGGRRERQRDRLLHRPAGARRRRSGRARPSPPRAGRRGRELDDACVHDHGRPARRLAPGLRRPRGHPAHARRGQLVWNRVPQEEPRDLPTSVATGRVCSSPPTATTCTGRR